jgi:alkylation response protein AidB-like acyl-CoA dehydrogenase
MSTLLAKYQPVFEAIAAGAVRRERDRELPHEPLRQLADAGFTAVRVPVEHGGDGATLPELFELLVQLAAADSNLPQALRGHFAFVEDRLQAPDDGDRDEWLRRFAKGEIVGNAVTEIGDVRLGDTATRLLPDGDGWRIRGRKYYTTGSIFADWADVTALTPDGVEVAALVRTDQDGVSVSDDWSGFGQRLTGSGTAVFADVPVQHVYPFSERFPYQTSFYQLVLDAVLAGIARAVERDLSDAVRRRTRTFSHATTAQVRDDPQILELVGRISAEAFAAEAVVARAAEAVQRVADARDAGAGGVAEAKREAELASARAQLVTSRIAVEVASGFFDALGASATETAALLDRHWRNARTVRSHNPLAYKARIIGDAVVNAAEPPYEWYVGTPAPRSTPDQTGAHRG